MRPTLLAAAVILALFGCEKAPTNSPTTSSSIEQSNVTQAQIQAETARLNAWFEEKYEQQVMRSPLALTSLGRTERQAEIDDFSDAAYAQDINIEKANLQALKSNFNYAMLTEQAKLSYDLWVYMSEQAIAEYAFKDNRYIFEQMNAMHSYFPQILIALHKVENAEHMQQYLSRISAIAVAIDQLIAVSKGIAEKGVRPPYFAFDMVIEESKKIISGAPFDNNPDSALWADAQTKIADLVAQNKLTQINADTLSSKVKQALINDFKPAYERLIAWQESDRPNASAQALGASAYPTVRITTLNV